LISGLGHDENLLSNYSLLEKGFSPLSLGAKQRELIIKSFLEMGAKVNDESKVNGKEYSNCKIELKCVMEGKSYPEIASELCRKFASSQIDMNYELAVMILKEKIAKVVSFYPKPCTIKKFNNLISSVMPSWILTTNYDLLLETILTAECRSLDSSDMLISQNDFTPIWHLHGHMLEPSNLIITQEDYIKLFRPDQYRQTKLALLFKENVTVFMGYTLGDINIASALDLGKNSYKTNEKLESTIETGDFCSRIGGVAIQLIWEQESKDLKAYISENNLLIIEINTIECFLNEMANQKKQFDATEKEEENKKTEFRNSLLGASHSLLNIFRNDHELLENLVHEGMRSDGYYVLVHREMEKLAFRLSYFWLV
jgi:hypothetical protein